MALFGLLDSDTSTQTFLIIIIIITSYRPGGGETICPLPIAVRLVADLRPSAGSQRAYSLGWDRQTDGSRYSKSPLERGA